MSIFPKRTVPGQPVTVHWNFNTAALIATHIYPFVRIGVRDPVGQLTMLFEGHLLALPNPEPLPPGPSPDEARHLRKNLPLLVLADYLSGPRKREVLVELLQSMQAGRHFYFVYPVPADAPLGRYTLLSEVHSEGQVRYSKTADEDFFFVERVEVAGATAEAGASTATVRNPGPEPVPVKVVEYFPSRQPNVQVRTQELPAHGALCLPLATEHTFLLYNEERQTLPLTASPAGPAYLRNQQLLGFDKPGASVPTTYVLAPGDEAGYELSGPTRLLWNRADGLASRTAMLAGLDDDTALREMLDADLLRELPRGLQAGK